MPRLKANTQLYGDYQGRTTGVRSGLILAGEIFDATDEQAEALEARGLAYRYMPPRPPAPEVASFVPTYDNKAIKAKTR
jgi:hypothetical protein